MRPGRRWLTGMLLEQLAPGTPIRVSFEDRGGRKFINRLEILP